MMADLGLPASSVSILSLLLRRHMSSTECLPGVTAFECQLQSWWLPL